MSVKFRKEIEILEKRDIKYSNTFVIEKSVWYPGLKYERLIKILEEYGLKRSTDPNENHLFGIINNKFYQTEFLLMNGFQFIDSFYNKYSLYLNLHLFFPLHYNQNYPRSLLLNPNTQWSDIKQQSAVYIARPIKSEQGVDIIKIYDETTLEQAKSLLYRDKYIDDGISITEYITNPMLYEGRKMHIRAYLLFSIINKVFSSYILDTMEIFTAKQKYQNTDWNNNDIHDSHFKNSGIMALLRPEIYNKLTPKLNNKNKEKLITNIKECIKYISKIAISNIQLYSGCKNAYEIYGFDIFVRDDLSVFIMEINGKMTGYEGADYIFKDYFNWIKDTVIKPTLFPNLKIEQRPETTPIYTTQLLNL
jgi:glutathione synthase/RimK-type ligase-like ATP-grasp enzyme